MTPLPYWLVEWWRGTDTGTSSRTIAAACIRSEHLLVTMETGAPRDTSDVGRCVRLLDLALVNGQDWRRRLHEVVGACRAWAVLVPCWDGIEVAYREDVAAQSAWQKALLVSPRGRRLRVRRHDIPMPPSRCLWLVSTLRGDGDPYEHRVPHPFAAPS